MKKAGTAWILDTSMLTGPKVVARVRVFRLGGDVAILTWCEKCWDCLLSWRSVKEMTND